jgi:hypothetical protein
MEVICQNLGLYPILVSAVETVFQIYQFDNFRINLKFNHNKIVFDVPSTEWLEEYTSLLVAAPPVEKDIRLFESGMRFRAKRADGQVNLFVSDVLTNNPVNLSLTNEEARQLHEGLLTAILEPFEQQGGRLETLRDLSLFKLTD